MKTGPKLDGKLYHLIIKHVKSKATRCCFPDKLRKVSCFSFSYGPFASPLSGEKGVETEEWLSLTLANAMVQKGTTVQCQPLRGWHIGHGQRHCGQTKVQRHTHSYTLKHTDKLAKEKFLKVYFLFLLHELLKDLDTCDKRFKLKPKYLKQTSTTQTNCNTKHKKPRHKLLLSK